MTGKIGTSGFLAALLLALLALGAEAPAAHLLNGLVAAAVSSGQDAKLPPHLSVLLGISATETSTPVRQLGFKNGDDIKTLNVCAADHHNIVLMSVGSNNRANAYLMSADGVLRKAITYEVGGATRELRISDGKGDFLRERTLWFERAAALGIMP